MKQPPIDYLENAILEITTNIECPVNCTFCPQQTLTKNFKSKNTFVNYGKERIMNLATYGKILSTIPKTVRIDFSGMAEPFAAKDCGKMIEYTVNKGHKVAVYTTLVGATLDDVKILEKIEFTKNNKLCIHLPDKEKNFRAKVNNNYKEVFKSLVNSNKILEKLNNGSVEFMTMSGTGEIDKELLEIFPYRLQPFVAITRAGNLYNNNEKFSSLSEDKKRKNGKLYCKAAKQLNHNVVLPNGDVVLCCMDYSIEHKIGNLVSDPYESLFTSTAYEQILYKQQNDEGKDDIICRNCEDAGYL